MDPINATTAGVAVMKTLRPLNVSVLMIDNGFIVQWYGNDRNNSYYCEDLEAVKVKLIGVFS